MRVRHDPVSGQRQGISFRIENCSFGGYQVDPSCTLRKLEEALSLRQEQVLKQYLGAESPLPGELQPKQVERLEEEHVHRHVHRLRLSL